MFGTSEELATLPSELGALLVIVCNKNKSIHLEVGFRLFD